MAKRVGRTIFFEKCPGIEECAAVVGKKEGEGPLAKEFDKIYNDGLLGEKSFEKAESRLQTLAVQTALKKAGISSSQIDCIFAGDLLNQCIGSSFGLMKFGIPFVGLYGACSTMALSVINAALHIECGAADRAAAVTSSHFCSAERQYRFPLEYGSQRPQTAQWTVTGSGCLLLSKQTGSVYIHSATVGVIQDLGVKDANNMGAAMAPAAFDTIYNYFKDTKTSPDDYDVIFTGDLGFVGSTLLCELFDKEGTDIRKKHKDCGLMIFDREKQDVHSGGSGCGCSASVLCSHIMKKLVSGEYRNVLFCATGALLSPTSTMQGDSIPVIAHLVNFRSNNQIDKKP